MHKIALESFEDTIQQTGQPSAEYTKGYSKGYAAGIDAVQAEQDVLKNELIQSISDLEFKYHEARGEIIGSLAPLFSSLVEKVFPACISERFSEQIVSILQEAAIQNETSQFKLSVSPEQRDAITAALAETTITTEITVDPRLSQNAAWISYDQRELYVNCDHLLANIRTVLSSVDSIETRSDIHG